MLTISAVKAGGENGDNSGIKSPSLPVSPVSLPIETVTSRAAILGISGSGKTYTALV